MGSNVVHEHRCYLTSVVTSNSCQELDHMIHVVDYGDLGTLLYLQNRVGQTQLLIQQAIMIKATMINAIAVSVVCLGQLCFRTFCQ